MRLSRTLFSRLMISRGKTGKLPLLPLPGFIGFGAVDCTGTLPSITLSKRKANFKPTRRIYTPPTRFIYCQKESPTQSSACGSGTVTSSGWTLRRTSG